MTTVGEIYDFIDTLAPFGTQDGFDNSGLLVGDGGDPVTRVAVCLDITNGVIAEARAAGAELIVSHHPVIFHKPARIGRDSPVYKLIESGIDALCVHTPIDMARGGISDLMLRRMGLDDENAEVLDPIRPAEGIGYGRVVRLGEETTAAALAERVKAAFGCPFVRYVDGGKAIRTVAVSSGAGNDEIYTAIGRGADALVTGDVKHHGFIDAKNAGLTVIDAGHYHTEIIVCEPLTRRLSDRFPEVRFFIPRASADCCETR
ncbi:MAG: Nif3-like dinuclear metal center hexameric protein [Bacteroides sp.]|nr:Nif3-like dinuclear metal center hexameric protein [Eubacterium sp.]MCM1418389.1 Nif3-like dinuclear metal center hexameric protein [Roseburia sp.]MCM1462490.1 Nif3-like dinuclear metal center hexameric protein [Bacteroides sp.]